MMLTLKTKLTNRKYYNKWLYKISVRVPGCSIFRSATLEEIKNFCTETDHDFSNLYVSWKHAWANKEFIYEIANFLSAYSKDEYCLRVERNILDIYTNNKEFYETMSMQNQSILVHRFQPNEKSLDILSNDKNCIVVDKLPKGRYNFRVYLLPHKMAHDKEGKQKYVDWLKRQVPKVTCTPAVQKWFLTTDWNWDRRYVLVEDEATLLMLKLRNSDVVGRVYNFIISDK
jgi:hypothetical protein